MTQTTIKRPEELVSALRRSPQNCRDLVDPFARQFLALEQVGASDGDLAFARRDGHKFRITHSTGNGFLVHRTDRGKRVFTGGDETTMTASQAVARLVRFSNGE